MRTSTRRHLATGLGAIAVVGSLTACGSDGDVTPTAAAPSPSGSAAPTSTGGSASDGGASDGGASDGGASDGPTASDGASGSPGSADASTGEHTDGSYSATGSYLSPAGEETIAVSVTLANDVITAVTVTPQAEDPTAKEFEKHFAAGIAAVVVGQDIDDVSVGTVSGSSLTGAGFNTALTDISSQSAH